MTKLPVLSGRVQKAGFVVVRVSGSHQRLQHEHDPARATTVPVHGNRDLPKGTLRDIVEQAGLTVEEFVALL